MNAGNEKNRKKYPLLPYLIGMFVVVITLVLLTSSCAGIKLAARS